jgi:hypothetical protein
MRVSASSSVLCRQLNAERAEVFDNLSQVPSVDVGLLRSRYVETLLHCARACFLSGQLPEAEDLWKQSISFCMKHLGRDSYEILIASNGLSEYYLEQLRLTGRRTNACGAERFP